MIEHRNGCAPIEESGLHGFLLRHGWIGRGWRWRRRGWRGRWAHRWARHHGSQERVEARVRSMEARLGEHLRLRPEQAAALRETVDAGLTLLQHSRDTTAELRRDAASLLRHPDPDGREDGSALADLLRRAVRVPPGVEAWDGLIEQAQGFYRSLDPTQRAKVRGHLARRWSRWADDLDGFEAAQDGGPSKRPPEA